MSKSSETIFFIDRALGQKAVPEALHAAGATVKIHASCFAPDAKDVEWLPAVSELDWVVLTKDEGIGRKLLEIEAIAHAGARVFILVSGNLTRQQMANIFVSVLEKLGKFTQGNQAPFIAKIYKDGRVVLWKNRTQLLKLVKGNDPSECL